MTAHADKLTIPAPTQQADAATPAHGSASQLRPAPVAGLTVGHVDDPAEVAAEARATSVLSRLRRFAEGSVVAAEAPTTTSLARLRRYGTAHPTQTEVGRSGGAVEAGRGHQISSRLGRGAPLSDGVRRRMEAGFGTPLGHVRVHDDSAAAQHSAALGAKAFTVGNDVFLGGGINPVDAGGEHVLAHEIAHVLAEGGARATPVRRNPEDGDPVPAPAQLSAAEIVASAANGRKNFSIPGFATSARSDEAGLLWTGLDVAPPAGTKYWVSADGQKRYRPPAYKPNESKTQSNFESLPPANPRGFWKKNAHLDITD